MDLTIRLEDFLTPEEIKAIAMDTIRDSIYRTFSQNEANINRLISNLSYEFIFEAVSKAIGEDAQTKISNKVRELLEDGSSIRYEVWRRKDAWENCESPAIGIVYKAIKDNEGLIRNKVMQSIDDFDFGDMRDIMYDTLQTVVYEKVFGKGGEANA